MSDKIEQLLRGRDLTHDTWKRALLENVLLGQTCNACGHATVAPKAACAMCGSFDLAVTEFDTTGEVYTETTVRVAPNPYEGPYQVALVDLGDAMLMARLDDNGDAHIGDTVELCGVVGEGDPGPLFRLTHS